MGISQTAPGLTEDIGGQPRRLLLRNGELERFEVQHEVGIFALFDQLFGRGPAPQVRHVRDLIALGLVGAGLSDRAADDLVSSLPPSDNLHLRAVAQRLLGVTFVPAVLDAPRKKRAAGSRAGAAVQPSPDTTPASASETLSEQSPA